MVEGPDVEPLIGGSDNKLLLKAVSDKQLFYLITHLLATVSAGIDVSMIPKMTESSMGCLRGCKKVPSRVHFKILLLIYNYNKPVALLASNVTIHKITTGIFLTLLYHNA